MFSSWFFLKIFLKLIGQRNTGRRQDPSFVGKKKKESCKLNTRILSDFWPTLGLDNFVSWKHYPITYRMLLGMADKDAMGRQQAAIPPLYQDRVRALDLAAWKKLEQGPTDALVSGVTQKPKDLAAFINKVNKRLQRKIPPPPGNLGTGLYEG